MNRIENSSNWWQTKEHTRVPWLLRISVVQFSLMHFQKIVQISGLCYFHYVGEGIPSLMPFWLLMPSVLQIFARPKKTYEPRIGYWVLSKHLSQRRCTIKIGFQIVVGCLFFFLFSFQMPKVHCYKKSRVKPNYIHL